MDENLDLNFSLDFELPTIVLQETTVGWLGEERVGCGNVYAGVYKLPVGEEAKGWVCELVLASSGLRWTVGKSSEFAIGELRYQVVTVTPKSEGKRGQVELVQV